MCERVREESARVMETRAMGPLEGRNRISRDRGRGKSEKRSEMIKGNKRNGNEDRKIRKAKRQWMNEGREGNLGGRGRAFRVVVCLYVCLSFPPHPLSLHFSLLLSLLFTPSCFHEMTLTLPLPVPHPVTSAVSHNLLPLPFFLLTAPSRLAPTSDPPFPLSV